MSAPRAWALRTGLSTDEVNLHLPALDAAGLLGIVEEAGRATVYLPARADLAIPGEWVEVPDRDWNAEWKRGIAPVEVAGFVIVPPWLVEQPGVADQPCGRVIVIEPAQAFGTGHHETTTGCLAALAERDLSGCSVLDVGTGTGLLAIAAHRLGARPVVAVDVDEVAVSTARLNAQGNAADVDVRLGSVEVAEGQFGVVLANLDTATLDTLATPLAARLAPGGILIASGVSVARRDQALSALHAAGLHAQARVQREWVVFVAEVPAEVP